MQTFREIWQYSGLLFRLENWGEGGYCDRRLFPGNYLTFGFNIVFSIERAPL